MSRRVKCIARSFRIAKYMQIYYVDIGGKLVKIVPTLMILFEEGINP